MKILIYTPFWKRPEIAREYIKSVERLRKNYQDIELLAILSPEDPHFGELLEMLKREWVVLCDNVPLGKKKNYGLKTAKAFEWDYMLELNSDSIVNCRFLEIYRPYMDKHIKFFGLKDLYVTEYSTKETLLLKDYNSGMTYGAGRMMHRSIVDYPMWADNLNAGLDDCLRVRLEKKGIPDCPIETDEPMLVELKCHTTINHFSFLKNINPDNRPHRPTVQEVSYDTVHDIISS